MEAQTAPREKSRESRAAVPGSMWVFALLFFLKAAGLALFVTPLWDVPDEVGHFAYVEDLASGRGIPVLGRGVIPAELVALWKPGPPARPVLNWVAIHPPGYHIAAVPFLWAARVATSDIGWQVRLTRLSSALFGAAALLFFFLLLREAGAGPIPSLAAAAGVGSIPMYSHLAAGVNNDVLSALLGALAALFWTRFLRSGSLSDLVKLGLALAGGGAVKLTALPLALAVLALLPIRLTGSVSWRLARWAAAAAISLSLPALWVARQWFLLGGPGVRPLSSRPFRPGELIEYLRGLPVADHTFKNFFGLIGWTGTGRGEVRWMQISGPFLAPFLLLALGLALAAAVWAWRRDRPMPGGAALSARAGWVLAALVFLFSLWLLWRSSGAASLAKGTVYALLLAVPFLSLFRLRRLRDDHQAAAVFTAQFAFLLFLAFYAANAWEAYELSGQMRATHGRYFFAAIGFLLLSFVLPAAELSGRAPRRDRIWLAALALLAANEILFFALRVVPFYRSA